MWPRNPALLPRMGVQLQASSFFERLTASEQIHTFRSLCGVSRPWSRLRPVEQR
jgi:ABC-2 type transport system ATP-binding protein